MKFKVFLTSIFLSLIFPTSALAATLSLSPASGTFNRGCQVTLDLNLDTGGVNTDGTDAILMYDTARFSTNNGSITPVTTTYPDFPGNNVDQQAGKITISGLASVSQPFTGQGKLATIAFTVKPDAAVGVSQITFDFDPNDKKKTTDSNVVERGTVADVLSSVVNGSYTIGTGTVCAAQGATGTGNLVGQGDTGFATPAAQPKTLDQAVDQTGNGPGTPQLTFTFAILGSIFTVLGVLGLALL